MHWSNFHQFEHLREYQNTILTVSLMAPSPEIIDISSDEDNHCHKRGNMVVKKERNRLTVSKDLDEDCLILDDDPDKPVRFESDLGNGTEELQIVAEKGQVACRDYPHARHLCARFPFDTNPHQKYCDMCHCYVCDTCAPCVYWNTGNPRDDHCHSTDKDELWRELRQYSKQGMLEEFLESRRLANTRSGTAPIHPEQSHSQPLTINEHIRVLSSLRSLSLDQQMVQGVRLTGIVKWFNGVGGYGFIIPDSGDENLFVHQSSITTEGYRSLSEGEVVEFEVGSGEDGRKMAINVTGRGGSFVRGTSARTVRPLVVSVSSGCYNCGEVGHFVRDCSNTGSTTENSSQFQDEEREMVTAERLTGIVKWYNNQRGMGYITPDNGGEDLFVGRSSIRYKGYPTLTEGEKVEFHIGIRDDGRKMAIDVGEITECYSCGETRHLARNCPQNECNKCGGHGHLDRDCTEVCYRCEQIGHLGWECPQLVCYKCGENGHLLRDCTLKVCDKCGEKGHLARECTTKMCHRCNEKGHLGWECPQLVCYKCDEHGHLARDCTLKVCSKCGEEGHLSRECTQKVCHRCDEIGHLGWECPQLVCYKCDENGHLSRDCPQKVCYKCDEIGHLGSDCPQIVCHRCNENGHFARECTQKVCSKCNEEGYLGTVCSHNACYNCGEHGHFARECIILQYLRESMRHQEGSCEGCSP